MALLPFDKFSGIALVYCCYYWCVVMVRRLCPVSFPPQRMVWTINSCNSQPLSRCCTFLIMVYSWCGFIPFDESCHVHSMSPATSGSATCSGLWVWLIAPVSQRSLPCKFAETRIELQKWFIQQQNISLSLCSGGSLTVWKLGGKWFVKPVL